MKKFILVIFLSLYTLFAEESKLELGVGLSALSFPDYLGSKSTKQIVLPFPYIRYQYKYLTIDKNGINRKLFGLNGLRLDISLGGSLPADSENSKAREGMPDLDFTGEIGPQLTYTIYDNSSSKLNFELPIRAVFSTNFTNLNYRGIVSSPRIIYSINIKDIELDFSTGAMFGDEYFHDYFYSVDQQYVSADRPYYQANSGLTSFRHKLTVTMQEGNWWAKTFLSYHDLRQSTFKGSPLVETKSATYAGLAVAYIFYTR